MLSYDCIAVKCHSKITWKVLWKTSGCALLKQLLARVKCFIFFGRCSWCTRFIWVSFAAACSQSHVRNRMFAIALNGVAFLRFAFKGSGKAWLIITWNLQSTCGRCQNLSNPVIVHLSSFFWCFIRSLGTQL